MMQISTIRCNNCKHCTTKYNPYSEICSLLERSVARSVQSHSSPRDCPRRLTETNIIKRVFKPRKRFY